MYRNHLTVAALALGLSGCAFAGSAPSQSEIQALPRGPALTPEALYERLTTADVVLLGEQHDNPHHHILQARIIDALVARGRRPALVVEMLEPEDQAAVDRARRDHPEDVDALAEAVRWAQSGWPAWSEYRPVFAAAYRHDLPIVAGNLPDVEARALVQRGRAALGEERRRTLGLERRLPPAEQQALAEELQESHCGMLAEKLLPGMALAQQARDGALARAAAQAAAANGAAVVITGNGHARIDRGIPWALQEMAPKLATAAVGLLPRERLEAGSGAAPPFHYVWFTRGVKKADDPCAALRSKPDKRG